MSELDDGSESLAVKVAELEKLVKENLAITKEVKHKVTKIQHWIFWQKLYHWLKWAIIILLILAAYYYLPPVIQKTVAPYQQLLNQTSSFGNTLKGLDQFKNINLNNILQK